MILTRQPFILKAFLTLSLFLSVFSVSTVSAQVEEVSQADRRVRCLSREFWSKWVSSQYYDEYKKIKVQINHGRGYHKPTKDILVPFKRWWYGIYESGMENICGHKCPLGDAYECVMLPGEKCATCQLPE